MEEGYSYGYNNARDAVSLTPRRQVVPLLLPDEFMGLPSLEGFIKFPDGFPAAPVSLQPRDWPRRVEGFIPYEDAKGPTSKAKAETLKEDEETSKVTANEDGEEGEDGGDLRKMKEATDRKREPAKRPKAQSQAKHKASSRLGSCKSMTVNQTL